MRMQGRDDAGEGGAAVHGEPLARGGRHASGRGALHKVCGEPGSALAAHALVRVQLALQHSQQ